jgi:hypothetical protein
VIAGAETQQRNAADITAAAPLAAEKVKGEKQGQATTNLPVIEQNTAYAQNILKNIVTHPGLEADVGLRSYLPVVRGTDRANFRSLRNQINGTAFLQAFQTLRGGGQISNVEGDKATSAITRLNDPNIDKESFVQAANELYNILDVGLQRARGEAQGNFNQNFSSEEFSKVNPGFNLPVSGNGSFTNDTGIPTDQARQAPDGNFYIPDPNRPGKYLMVQP